jgi:TRAP-type uncharacterized transport system substrate-binding protein
MRRATPTLIKGLTIAAVTVSGSTAAVAQAKAKRPSPDATVANTKADTAGPWSVAGKSKLNEWTFGLAAGRTEGAPLRLAAELARVMDDGERMRVLPIVTRGPFDNMADLLLLKGIDAAVLMGDTLEHFEKVEKVPRLHERVTYVASLFPSEVHIFVRPEIQTIADLAGKTVNFNRLAQLLPIPAH